MNISTYSYTNKGGRENNEDFCSYEIKGDKAVFVLADGLGGHKCGDVASKLAVEYIIPEIYKYVEFNEKNIKKIMDDVNDYIIKVQNKDSNLKDMRSTVVAAFIDGNIFRYFNVGDSRMYYFKNGCLYTQTKDHSVSQVAVKMGSILPEQVRFHDDRNKLLKVLGSDKNLNINKLYEPITIEPGDAFILCSDGFWEYVYEVEMEADLIKSDSPEQWASYMINRLLLRVTGNNDNYTTLTVCID